VDIPDWAPRLTDGAVTLRGHHLDDLEGVLAQGRDAQMQRWTTVPIPYEWRDAREWIDSREQRWREGSSLTFAIETAGRFAGSVDLRPESDLGAEVGYGLAPWARGRSVASRALRLVLQWAFGTLGLEVVHWRAEAGNWPSRRTAWAVGIRVEGLVRGLVAHRGSRQDGWIGSICSTDRMRPAHPWYDPPVLDTRGVRLRPHRAADGPRIIEAANDPLTQAWLPAIPSGYTADDAAAHLEDIREQQAGGRSLFWAITDDEEDLIAGEIGVFGLAGPSRSGELGYWAHPQARGRRLTSRAVRLAAEHALRPLDSGGLGLRRLVIRVANGNPASQQVALNAGFRPSGLDRDAEVLRDGTLADLHRFDLTAADIAAGSVGGSVGDSVGDSVGRSVGGRSSGDSAGHSGTAGAGAAGQ
jgi:RimJ/RimL family protein N-acetyltransferase